MLNSSYYFLSHPWDEVFKYINTYVKHAAKISRDPNTDNYILYIYECGKTAIFRIQNSLQLREKGDVGWGGGAEGPYYNYV